MCCSPAAATCQCSDMGASSLLWTRMIRRSPTLQFIVGPGMRPLMAMRRRRKPSGAPSFQATTKSYLFVRGLEAAVHGHERALVCSAGLTQLAHQVGACKLT